MHSMDLQKRKNKTNGPPVRPQCTECGKDFSNQSALSKHKLTHSDERRFVCNLCAKAFKRQDHLNGHMLTHRDKKPFECDVEGCEKTYCDARSLRRHKENHHSGTNLQNLQQPNHQTQLNVALLSGATIVNRIQYAPASSPSTATADNVNDYPSAATQLQLLALSSQQQQQQPFPQPIQAHQQQQSNDSIKGNAPVLRVSPETVHLKPTVIKSETFASSNQSETSRSSSSRSPSDPHNLLHQLLTQQLNERPGSSPSRQQHQTLPPPQQLLPVRLTTQDEDSRCHRNILVEQMQQSSHPWTPSYRLVGTQPSVQQLQNMPPHTLQAKSEVNESQVECSLCQRKFRNLPALNGHMRLHGGYMRSQQSCINNVNPVANNCNIKKKEDSSGTSEVKAIVDVIKERIMQKQAAAAAAASSLNSNSVRSNVPTTSPPTMTSLAQSNTPHSTTTAITSTRHPYYPYEVPSNNYVASSHQQTNQQLSTQQHELHPKHLHQNSTHRLSPNIESTHFPLHTPAPLETRSLDDTEIPDPEPSPHEIEELLQTNGPSQIVNHPNRDEITNDLSNEGPAWSSNELALLKEQLQQQFRIPSRPAHGSSLPRFNQLHSKYLSGESNFSRRHSDSAADMSYSVLDNNYEQTKSRLHSESVPSQIQPNWRDEQDQFSTQSSQASSQSLDLLKRRTQRAVSDPGSDLNQQQPDQSMSMMTINVNVNNNLQVQHHNGSFQYHSPYSHSNQFSSHSVPTTPTAFNPSMSSPNPQQVHHTHYPHQQPSQQQQQQQQQHSLPCTPTQPLSFTFSPHQVQQYQQQQHEPHSMPTTPTDQQQFSFNQQQTSPYSVNSQSSPFCRQQAPTVFSEIQQHTSQQQQPLDSIYEEIEYQPTESQTGQTNIANETTGLVDYDFEAITIMEQLQQEADHQQAVARHGYNPINSTEILVQTNSIEVSQYNEVNNHKHEKNLDLSVSAQNIQQDMSPVEPEPEKFLPEERNFFDHTFDSRNQELNKGQIVVEEESQITSTTIDVRFDDPGPSNTVNTPSISSFRSSSSNLVMNLPEEEPELNQGLEGKDADNVIEDLEANEEDDDVFLSPTIISPVTSPKRQKTQELMLSIRNICGTGNNQDLRSHIYTNGVDVDSFNIKAEKGCSKKFKRKPEPLYIPPHVNTSGYQSRLRSPRLWEPSSVHHSFGFNAITYPKDVSKSISPPPYTPPPMLSPVRTGSGLYWHIITGSITPKSGASGSFIYGRKSCGTLPSNSDKESVIKNGDAIANSFQSNDIVPTPTTAYEPFEMEIPETDILPHVNIGPQYQARIPSFNPLKDDAKFKYKDEKADKVWDPSILDNPVNNNCPILDEDLEAYLELACSSCVAGAGRNKEYALHVLYLSNGNIQEAISKLLDPEPSLPKEKHFLHDYQYPETDVWTTQEIEMYHRALIKCDKDFSEIVKEVKTKTVKQCVQFYYLWKKVCPDDYRRLRIVRRKKEQEGIFYNMRSNDTATENSEVVENSIQEKPIENGYNGDSVLDPGAAITDNDDNMSYLDSYNPSPATSIASSTCKSEYPCKICGKVFYKVKSRSAHMKVHGASSRH